MMESATMEYGSPLLAGGQGRSPAALRFIHVLEYLGDMKKAVEFYAVFGGHRHTSWPSIRNGTS